MTKKTVRLIRRADGIVQRYYISTENFFKRYNATNDMKDRRRIWEKIKPPEPKKPPAPENQLYTCRLQYRKKVGHYFNAELTFVSDKDFTKQQVEDKFKELLEQQGYEVAPFCNEFDMGTEETAEKAGINELLIRDRSPPDSKKMQMRLERWLA